MENRLDRVFSYQNNQTDTWVPSPNSHGRILLPSKTIIKTFDEESYRSIRGKNTLEGILLPWNLQTTWKRGNNSLFYIVAFNLGIPPGPLLMDLLKSLGSGTVVEDHGSTEGGNFKNSRNFRTL